MSEHDQDPYEGKTRKQYLSDLAGEYGVPCVIVFTLAGMLGPDEDFDGLINEVEDVAASGEFE